MGFGPDSTDRLRTRRSVRRQLFQRRRISTSRAAFTGSFRTFTLEMDAISSAFLLPILVVSAAAGVYGLSYWRQSEHEENGRRLSFWLGLLSASMMLLVVARDGVLFLLAWEVMAVSAFVCVSTEDHDEATQQAGWLYLAASHLATLCLFGVFTLMAAATGTFEFTSLSGVDPAMLNGIFVLGLVGFGVKAGIMPLHI